MPAGPAPDDLPRSPTGRIPKWVQEEAHGLPPSELVPWRAGPAAGSPRALPRRRSGSRTRTALTALAVVGLTAGVLTLTGGLGGDATGAGWPALSGGDAPGTGRTGGPPPGKEEKRDRLAPAAEAAQPSSAYRFLALQDDRVTPVTWSPCRPIHYVVRPDHSPAGGLEAVRTAFARLGDVTGLTFVYDGPTTEAPSTDRPAYQKDRYGDRWAPVLVTWATPDEVPDFGVEFLGEAGALRVRAPSGDLAYVTGAAAFDAEAMTRIVVAGRQGLLHAVLLHELGHLVGLGHVNDPAQIMAPRVRNGVEDYQHGDLNGLARLGQGPCRRDL